MEKSMNMTINRLPAITWNRLKMNEAFVPDVKIPVAGTYEEQLGKHAGINLGSGLELHQADENEKQLFDSIETALGKDMDKLGENFPVEVIQCTDEKNPEAGNQAILNLTADGRYGRYFLYVKANTRMNVAVYCTSKEKEAEPFFLQLKIYAEENAKLDLTVVQTMDKKQKYFPISAVFWAKTLP